MRMPDRPVVMGVLNVTPDSFSDGGQFAGPDEAVERGVELRRQGAQLVDVGGESTRPGADRIPVAVELERVMPVIEGLVARGARVSVDTMNAQTALAAAQAGAAVINDVSGGLADPEMYRIVAQTGLEYVAMHWRGHSDRMEDLAQYDDVVADVRSELKQRLAEMLVWGIDPARVILDPGLGFAKTPEHNWALLAALPQLESLGHRILIGASRKRFLGEFLPGTATAADRDQASAILSALAADAGVWGVRVHDVNATKLSLDLWSAWHAGKRDG
jgi:dihydropteroate synthase